VRTRPVALAGAFVAFPLMAFPLVAFPLVLAGCYSTGLRFPAHVRRIAVPIFGNETHVRGIEMDLTERVRQILLDRAEVGLAASEEQADASIRGRILRVNFPVLVGGNQPRILEGSAEASVVADLVDRASGRTLATVRGTDRAEFTVPLGERRESALRELIDELAWKVVLGLAQASVDRETPGQPGGAMR
jgi:lipopolysaccharide assembly LptE-like protein